MATQVEGEDIHVEDSLVFNPARWIRCQKQYKDVPLHVCNALVALRQMPDSIEHLLPVPELSVTDFIGLELPSQSAELITTKVNQWFSFDAPQENVQTFLRRSIPPLDFINKLENNNGQAWFDGKISIVDPRFTGSNNRLPFWFSTYWRRMATIIKAQRDWREAKGWIQRETEKLGLPGPLPSQQELFALVGWNVPLARTVTKIAGMTTYTLSQFLSNRWLDQEAMELMISHLQKRLQQDPVRSKKNKIASCQFFELLIDAANTNCYGNTTISSSLHNIEIQVEREGLRHLYIPVFGNHHEVVAYVDFDEMKVGYG
jgi:hypothetical protein